MVEINGQVIREHMMKAALNVKDFADEAKLSPATAQKVIGMGGKVQFQTVGRIAKCLNVEPQAIIKAYA